MSVDTQAAADDELEAVIRFGRRYVQERANSAFPTAHLSNFLDALEAQEHRSCGRQPDPASGPGRRSE